MPASAALRTSSAPERREPPRPEPARVADAEPFSLPDAPSRPPEATPQPKASQPATHAAVPRTDEARTPKPATADIATDAVAAAGLALIELTVEAAEPAAEPASDGDADRQDSSETPHAAEPQLPQLIVPVAVPPPAAPGETTPPPTEAEPADGGEGAAAPAIASRTAHGKGEAPHAQEPPSGDLLPANGIAAAQPQAAIVLPVRLDVAEPIRLQPRSEAQPTGPGVADTGLQPEPEVPLSRPTPLHAVPLEIGLQAMSGRTRFDIRLDPAELGRVDIRLDISDDGDVSAKLVVDRVETLQWLQRDARTLERAFEQAGFRTADGSVDIQLRDRGGDGGYSGQPQQRDPAAARSADQQAEPSPVLPEPPRRLVRLGGVDRNI